MSPAVATTPVAALAPTSLEYLLLGDLRVLLEDEPGHGTSRGLLAVLDRLLATGHRAPAVTSETEILETPDAVNLRPLWGSLDERSEFHLKLKRLRDRIAVRAPYAILANEVRCELQHLIATIIADGQPLD